MDEYYEIATIIYFIATNAKVNSMLHVIAKLDKAIYTNTYKQKKSRI